ncbi:hypothetical protein LCGC14_1768610 [marine sediment metagenome]|uniref:Uncharacterized protein n=1 Tax=marine sediment metagenome TaxID=412755 RepID=A0A0F9JYN6_9ZZZZ
MEFWKVAIIVRPNNGGKSEFYPPRYLRRVIGKWAVEFRFGCVKDSLKALEIIRKGGIPV